MLAGSWINRGTREAHIRRVRRRSKAPPRARDNQQTVGVSFWEMIDVRSNG